MYLVFDMRGRGNKMLKGLFGLVFQTPNARCVLENVVYQFTSSVWFDIFANAATQIRAKTTLNKKL